MIQIFDDIIDIYDQEIIKKYILNDDGWTYVDDVSLKNNSHQRRPGFKKIFDTKNLHMSIKNLIYMIRWKMEMIPYNAEDEILEIRSFLQLPLNKEFIGQGVDTPHLDRTEPHLVFLYYVTDSDGDTIIYDYKSKSPGDIPYFEDIKELKRITPKQGRVVVFDGLHWHTAEQPTKDVRCILNINENHNI